MILAHFVLWVLCCMLGGAALADKEDKLLIGLFLIGVGAYNGIIFLELSGLIGGAA